MVAIIVAALTLQPDPIAEARGYAELGDLGRAIDVLSKACAEKPSAPMLAFLAQLQTTNDQIPQASRSLEAALELAPGQARLRTTLGALYFRLGRLEQAEQTLTQALARESQNPIAHYYLGAAQKNLGKLDEARASVERVLALLPGRGTFDPAEFSPRVNALYLSAEIHAAHHEWAASERVLRELLESEPTHPGARYVLSQALVRAGRRADAEIELNRFAEMKKAQEHLELGLNLVRHAGSQERALSEFRLALEAHPDHPRAMYFLALGLARRGEDANAVALFERLIVLRPDASTSIEPLLARLTP